MEILIICIELYYLCVIVKNFPHLQLSYKTWTTEFPAIKS